MYVSVFVGACMHTCMHVFVCVCVGFIDSTPRDTTMTWHTFLKNSFPQEGFDPVLCGGVTLRWVERRPMGSPSHFKTAQAGSNL